MYTAMGYHERVCSDCSLDLTDVSLRHSVKSEDRVMCSLICCLWYTNSAIAPSVL